MAGLVQLLLWFGLNSLIPLFLRTLSLVVELRRLRTNRLTYMWLDIWHRCGFLVATMCIGLLGPAMRPVFLTLNLEVEWRTLLVQLSGMTVAEALDGARHAWLQETLRLVLMLPMALSRVRRATVGPRSHADGAFTVGLVLQLHRLTFGWASLKRTLGWDSAVVAPVRRWTLGGTLVVLT